VLLQPDVVAAASKRALQDMTPLSENLDTPPIVASRSDVRSVKYPSTTKELHPSSSQYDALHTTPKRSSSLPRDVKVARLDNEEDSRSMLQDLKSLQGRHEAPHTHEHGLQDCFSLPQPEDAYKSEMCKTTMPNTETKTAKDRHSLTTIDMSERAIDCAEGESPTTSRRSTFVRAAGNMPTSSPVQLQLWESVPSSSSNTLVGSPGHIREYLRGHTKTPSGSSVAQESRRSSSISREGICHDEREGIQRHLSPTTGTGQPQLDKSAPRSGSFLPPVRYASWAEQDRPRSGSIIDFQLKLPGSRQGHNRHSSIPQLSPIMPLVFQPDLPLAMLGYTSRTVRILYALYPLLYFAHVPLALFLDVNVLYALVQIALHPAAVTYTGDGGNIQGKPRLHPWWIAIGLYAFSTFIWFFVVLLLHDLYYRNFKVWKDRKLPYPLYILSRET
jgi:hypothetical protein